MLSKSVASALLVLSSALPALAVVPEWGQCGGINYTGDTVCASGLVCKEWNPYYFQCVTSAIGGTSSSTRVTSSTSTSRSSSTSSSTVSSSSSTRTTISSSSSSTSTTISSSSTTRTSSTPGPTGSTCTSIPPGNTLPIGTPSPTGLHALAQAKGRYFGTAFDNSHIADTVYTQLVLSEFGQLTPENSQKWNALEQSQGVFNTWLWADRVVNITRINCMTTRGHTLVWHSQLPSWVEAGNFNNATLVDIMKTHITTIMEHWKGQIHTWDVVNEVLDDSGGMRNSVFYRTIGEYFIDIAFKTAKAADGAAILAINDYNIDVPGGKSTGMINLVTRLKARGVPVEQIGIQAHLIVGQVPSSVLTNWQAFAALGVSIAITELDIRTTTPPSTTALAQQATDYNRVVSACLAISACKGITVWGASDKYSWVPNTFGGQGAALPFDATFVKKPAYAAIVSALTA